MEKMLSGGIKITSSQNAKFQACLEQAEICCEQARLAAHRRCYEAACGLFSTAIALYQCAITMTGTITMTDVSYAAIAEQLRYIEIERSAYFELAKSMARPLLSRHATNGMQRSRGNKH